MDFGPESCIMYPRKQNCKLHFFTSPPIKGSDALTNTGLSLGEVNQKDD